MSDAHLAEIFKALINVKDEFGELMFWEVMMFLDGLLKVAFIAELSYNVTVPVWKQGLKEF